jgi:HlyD family secretion protein
VDKIVKRKNTRKIGLILIVSSLLVAALYIVILSGSFDKSRLQKVAKSSITISTAREGFVEASLNVRGKIAPQKTIYLDSVSGGRVEQKFVERGDYVKKGEPLAQLSNTSLQLDVMSREAQVTEQLNFLRNTQMTMETNRLNLKRDLLEIELQISHLERKYKQSTHLMEQGLIPQETLDEVRENLVYYRSRKELTLERQDQENSIRKAQIAQLKDSAEMLEKNLEFARKNIENLLIKSPVNGHLSEFNIELGESKQAGSRLGQIDIPGDYKVSIFLDEYYLSQVGLGDELRVKLKNTMLKVHISKVDSRVSNSQFLIEADLPSDIQGLTSGMSVEAELVLSSNNQKGVILDRGAFFSSTGGNWVFVLSDDGEYAERRPIRIGITNKDYYEILDGVNPGERVITSSYSGFERAEKLELH